MNTSRSRLGPPILLEDRHHDDTTHVTECRSGAEGCVIYRRRTSREKSIYEHSEVIFPGVKIVGDDQAVEIVSVGPPTVGTAWRTASMRLFLDETLGFSKLDAYEVA